MKAWQFAQTGQPLQFNEIEEPTSPEPGWVILEMKAAGICHSDVGVMEDEGWLSMLAHTPITLGHENAGVVAEVGEGVTEFKVGDRVGVCPTTEGGAPGYSYNGGFAPKMHVPAVALVSLPDKVDFISGAAATDAGMTSYAAVITQGGVKKGDNVGIIGLGGLGQVGARIAALEGANVYIAEINEKVWDMAEAVGAKGVKKSISEFEDVEFDVIVDFAGFGNTTAEAVDIIRRDGTVVVVGMGKLEATINTKSLILNQCRLVGSNGGTKEDIAGIYELIATDKLNPTLTTISFDEIDAGIQKLKDGEVVGRLVVDFDK